VSQTKYCPNCGVKLDVQVAKFCPECGLALGASKSEKSVNEDSPYPIKTLQEHVPEINAYELGTKLEEVVETIYKSKGYVTRRRQRLEGKSGTKSEIDIIAERGMKVIAIECKNYSGTVGIEKVRDFSEKLRDLDLNGVFVSLYGLSQEAEHFAESRHIETMDSGELMEKWWIISVGRGQSVKGQSLTLEYALPLNISYNQVTRIYLKNKDKIKISEAELIFHPYFYADYVLSTTFRDPVKNLHKFKDSGTIYVDALDGKILNSLPEKGLGIIKTLKILSSQTENLQNSRTTKLLNELSGKNALSHYQVQIEESYKATKLKPAISIAQATNSVMEFIIEKNTADVSYTIKKRENDWPETKQVTFIPKRKDIRISHKDVIIIPRWSVEFESLNKTYRREVLACSGQTLEDTMAYCPQHFRIGAITFSQKPTIAVCEICGTALCSEHVMQCAVCGKWLCEAHSFECEVCKNHFCKEHPHLQCTTCGGQLCGACIKTCPECHHEYSPNHSLTCDKCKQAFCPNCVTVTGLIRKNRTCKNCL
jgi:hypothetical protein